MHQVGIALAMFLQSVVSHDVGPAPGPCLAGRVDPNDGGQVAICIGSAPDMVRDMDGQLFFSPHGVPMYPPGWRPVPR